tara:strand:- start:536 stop:799 length:264 start_codon:yes stop_codon:yes gene_type:complete
MKIDDLLGLLDGWGNKNTLTQLRDGFSGPLLPFFALAATLVAWLVLVIAKNIGLISFPITREVFFCLLISQAIPAAWAYWLKIKFPS